MNFEYLQDKIYYEDEGTLRDIYILNTDINDWEKWVNVVNKKYLVEFYNGKTKTTENQINFQIVKNYLTGKTDLINKATIKLKGIDINCHFFSNQEIENDIDPIQIKSIEDHNLLMDYLKTISSVLNKK